MKYYNIYNEGRTVLLFDTDKFEIVSTYNKDIIHDSKEFEEGSNDKPGYEGAFRGYEKKDGKELIKAIDDFVNNLKYDKEKGSYLVMYPNGEWDMYDDFDGVYTKFEVRNNLIVFKQIEKLPKDYQVNHWNGSDWLNGIVIRLCY